MKTVSSEGSGIDPVKLEHLIFNQRCISFDVHIRGGSGFILFRLLLPTTDH